MARSIAFVIIALYLTLGVTARLLAQGVDFLSIQYEVQPGLVTSTNPNTFFVDSVREISSFKLQTTFPLLIKPRTTILNSLSYLRYDVNPENPASVQLPPVHSVGYTLILSQKLRPKWELLTFAGVELASDFKGKVSGQDFTFLGAAGLVHKFNARFSGTFGMFYAHFFSRPLVLPFFEFSWQLNHRWNLDFSLTQLFLTFAARENIAVGMLFDVPTNQFHSTRLRQIRNSNEDIYFRQTTALLGVFFKYKFSGLYLTLAGGFAGVQHELFNGKGKRVGSDSEVNFKDTIFLRLGFGIPLF